MSLAKRVLLACVGALFSAGGAIAQSWGAGVTIGAVNDIEHHFAFEDFKPKDINGSIEFEVQEKVIVRATYGEMRVKGENAGKTVTLAGSGSEITLPDLTNDIRYATIGVSYQFWEGTFTSGIFGGFGGYKIEPRGVPAEIANYRDQRETSLGLHVGVEGGFELIRHLSLMVRLTYHGIRTTSNRSLVNANTGLTYRF